MPTPPEGPTHNVSCTKAMSTIGGSRLVDAAIRSCRGPDAAMTRVATADGVDPVGRVRAWSGVRAIAFRRAVCALARPGGRGRRARRGPWMAVDAGRGATRQGGRQPPELGSWRYSGSQKRRTGLGRAPSGRWPLGVREVQQGSCRRSPRPSAQMLAGVGSACGSGSVWLSGTSCIDRLNRLAE